MAWVMQRIITNVKHFHPCSTKYLSDSMSLDCVMWKRLPSLQMWDFSFISLRLSVCFFPAQWGIGRCGNHVACWDCLCRRQVEPFISRNHSCDALPLIHIGLHIWQRVWWRTKALGVLRNGAIGSRVLWTQNELWGSWLSLYVCLWRALYGRPYMVPLCPFIRNNRFLLFHLQDHETEKGKTAGRG